MPTAATIKPISRLREILKPIFTVLQKYAKLPVPSPGLSIFPSPLSSSPPWNTAPSTPQPTVFTAAAKPSSSKPTSGPPVWLPTTSDAARWPSTSGATAAKRETDLNARVYALFGLTIAEIQRIEAATKYHYGKV